MVAVARQKITLAPLARIEGHGEVNLFLGDNGRVQNARFRMLEFRGFEKLCQGRMLWELPLITPRICGICPTSHHITSVKACEDLLGARIPPAAEKLRELMLLGEIISSHAVAFFYLALPDFLACGKGGVVALSQRHPSTVADALALRSFGEEASACVGGHAIQPVGAIPGGMSKPLSSDDRFRLFKKAKEAVGLAHKALELAELLPKRVMDLPGLSIPTPSLALSAFGRLSFYSGRLSLIGEAGETREVIEPGTYFDHFDETNESWTYGRFPYHNDGVEAQRGRGAVSFRCGPLARANAVEAIDSPMTKAAFEEFRRVAGRPACHPLYYHWLRLVEILYACERAVELLEDDGISDKDVRVAIQRTEGRGVGVIEAPRGTLVHEYTADARGKVVRARFVMPTTHNNAAINRDVLEVARTLVRGKLTAKATAAIEQVVRAYDPCLSCATHQIGPKPTSVRLYDHEGRRVPVRRPG